MNENAPGAFQNQQPSALAVRLWLGLMLALWIVIQMIAIFVSYMHMMSWPLEKSEHPDVFCRVYATAMGTAVLAMLFIVVGVALILNRRWARPAIIFGACLQIVVTVATQIWEARVPMPEASGLTGLPAAALGIVLWNIVPVGILILAAALKPPAPGAEG